MNSLTLTLAAYLNRAIGFKLVLCPELYERARASGYDMTLYEKAKSLPLISENPRCPT